MASVADPLFWFITCIYINYLAEDKTSNKKLGTERDRVVCIIKVMTSEESTTMKTNKTSPIISLN